MKNTPYDRNSSIVLNFLFVAYFFVKCTTQFYKTKRQKKTNKYTKHIIPHWFGFKRNIAVICGFYNSIFNGSRRLHYTCFYPFLHQKLIQASIKIPVTAYVCILSFSQGYSIHI